jgi:hypothetical protein
MIYIIWQQVGVLFSSALNSTYHLLWIMWLGWTMQLWFSEFL